MTQEATNTKPGFKGSWHDTDGGSAMMFAVGLTVVFGAAAVAVDYARALTSRQLLASAADVAVLAAVSGLPDQDAARRIAMSYVEKNLPSDKFGKALAARDIEFGTWDSECGEFRPLILRSYDEANDLKPSDQEVSRCKASASNFGLDPSAIRLTTRLSQSNGNELDMLFGWLLGRSSMDVSASAVAARGGPPCVLALDPNGSGAMHLEGSATVNTIGCGVQVNSTSSPGLEISGGAYLSSSNICVSGRAQYRGGQASPEPTEYCPSISDPMAGLETPEVDACDHNNLAIYNSSRLTLDPGVYCGGLRIDGGSEITLSPGLYIIQDGPLIVGGDSTISGSEVTIFLTGKPAVLNLGGGSMIDLKAPTSGPMEGVLFFQDPRFGGTHNWGGNASTSLRGVIYFPSGTLFTNNDNSIMPERSCVVLIAHRLDFTGASGVSIDVTQSNCRNSLPGPYSRGIVLLD